MDDTVIPRKVAFYIRVSTEDQATKFGPDVQRAALDALLKTKLSMDGLSTFIFAGEKYVYQDDISGTTKLQERPAFSQLQEDYLMADDGQKPFDTVAVFKIDRFARKLTVLMDVLEFFEENKIEFLSATESLDTSTPFGKAMLGIMGVLAELDRENILIRTTGGRQQAIQQGVHIAAPFGYIKNKEKKLEIFDAEAEVVKKIFSLFTSSRFSPQKIADLLQQEEFLSPEASAIHFGKRKGELRKTSPLHFWRMETVREILSDKVYIGMYFYDKTKKGKRLPENQWKQSPYRHEPIIPEPLFEFAQARLSEISARKTLSQKRVDENLYLLSSLIKCDNCRKLGAIKESEMSWTGGRKLIDKNTNRYSYYYMCNRKNRKKYPDAICPVVPIPAEPLEEYVTGFIKQLLLNPNATYEYQKSLNSSRLRLKHLKLKRKRFMDLINGLPKVKENILKQHELSAFDHSVLKNKLADLESKKDKHTKEIEKIDLLLTQESLSLGYEYSLELYSKKYSKALQQAMLSKKDLYELIHMLIDRIVIYSRPRNDRDVIAGRKKEDQLIPEAIDIQLNLPQKLLHQLIENKFGAKSVNM